MKLIIKQQLLTNRKSNNVRALGIILFAVFALLLPDALYAKKHHFTEAALDPAPSAIPDRIILTWKSDPATTQAVTWRTDATVNKAVAEIVVADPAPDFFKYKNQFRAITTSLKTETGLAYYHSVNFTNLEPNTLYAYRVGGNDLWSEWFQFRTANDRLTPFSFVYVGDAQNAILSLWSRTIRAAVLDEPDARFIIHAGDLVNYGNYDLGWAEWFEAAGWIHAMVPSIPAAGNHEYYRYKEKGNQFSQNWRPQFALPENGVKGLEETVYHIDYQGCRFIVLNSNEKLDEQAKWLEDILEDNPCRWTFAVFHHPIYSSARGRDNKELRKLWKPIIDKYRVDLVLQGHDHTYARGNNLPVGTREKDEHYGTVYVVSVSGPKMYTLTDNQWMDRAAENTQLYQIISVTPDTLHYRAMTATGDVYDAFDLLKGDGKTNLLIERLPAGVPERRKN